MSPPAHASALLKSSGVPVGSSEGIGPAGPRAPPEPPPPSLGEVVGDELGGSTGVEVSEPPEPSSGTEGLGLLPPLPPKLIFHSPSSLTRSKSWLDVSPSAERISAL